ncbi:beta-aspartyl-peptidase (threonine type) [Blastomonas natatoria]|uniref:Beta-aspartyl-peptidase (Threonine type) n=1 Tax=Blastomonas natatoria TaxID=34015 RepID=A0A2V3V6Z6_9SPHN|nr:isoaspartyl peptidase/L-asparaginase [Blastomonas natatoria]PXW77602.1 beta-aspartyl-peptidase (threonine type) [Blastomonas natatoria]
MSDVLSETTADHGWSLVIHGGSGQFERGRLSAEADAGARAGLDRALAAGSEILAQGGSALDAVEAAIVVLEDDPHFNAGHGSVYTYEGKIELDAAVMNGANRTAGAIARAHHTKNPILLARKVMEDSPHVLLSGEGADRFSAEMGLTQVDNAYFGTPERLRQLEELKANSTGWFDVDMKYGTVGAVARDINGHVAAGTSTGGLTGKRYGRIGDSPLIGAGTYADDRSCAISATGAGEFFIRVGVAHEICTRIRLKAEARAEFLAQEAERSGAPLDEPARGRLLATALSSEEVQEIVDAVMAEMVDLGGTGGVIYLTPWGHQGYAFRTPGMYRGMATSAGASSVAVYGDE